MKVLAALALSVLLSGCVVAPAPYVAEVSYEPEVVVGLYPIGFYQPGYGYWTGTAWDVNFYAFGHRGYGHYYRGAPGFARGHYVGHGAVSGGFRHR